MEMRRLGTTGVEVSCVGLGLMPLAIAKRPDGDAAVAVIHAALDAGVTWLDTADSYCLDESDIGYGERLVKRALDTWRGPKERIFVTTKGGFIRPGGGWEINAHPTRLRTACEASLKALGVERISLYQLHHPDKNVYWPDSVGALAELRREGKIEHIGLSNVDAGHIKDAAKIVPIATVQNRCNVVERNNFGNGVVSRCEDMGLSFIAHSPVGGHHQHYRIAQHPVLNAIAARREASPYEVALQWLLASSPSVVTIPGASKVSSALSSIRAADLRFTPEDRNELDQAFPPASFVVKQLVRLRRKARQVVRNARRSS
jgi:aryl-alcohol dehydrogenase-like predicted oxidoreductase